MSLLMDTQTNRFWARVDFLATGEIVLHIPEECELPIRVLVSRGGRSTEYEPNSSEKPNNCDYAENPSGDVWECSCYQTTLCEHQKEDFNPDGTINIVECGYEPKDEPTISKMEQVDKDINVRSKEPQTPMCETCRYDKPNNPICDECILGEDKPSNYAPQTDCAWR